MRNRKAEVKLAVSIEPRGSPRHPTSAHFLLVDSSVWLWGPEMSSPGMPEAKGITTKEGPRTAGAEGDLRSLTPPSSHMLTQCRRGMWPRPLPQALPRPLPPSSLPYGRPLSSVSLSPHPRQPEQALHVWKTGPSPGLSFSCSPHAPCSQWPPPLNSMLQREVRDPALGKGMFVHGGGSSHLAHM